MHGHRLLRWSRRLAPRPGGRQLVDARSTTSPTGRTSARTARDLPARRHRRRPAGVLSGAVRRRQQLDARVPGGLRDPASAPASGATRRRTAWSSGCCSTASRSTSSRDEAAATAVRRSTRGSYVVFMNQARRGLADTALAIGVDISSQISRLYAPPGAWSHGYLWGADVRDDPRRPAFAPRNAQADRDRVELGRRPGTGAAGLLRARGRLADGGADAERAARGRRSTRSSRSRRSRRLRCCAPPGRVIFAAARRRGARSRRVRTTGSRSSACSDDVLPALEPIDRVPRIAVLTGRRSTRTSGRCGTSGSRSTRSVDRDAQQRGAADPLASYDVVFNTGAWPATAQPTARARLTAFFDARRRLHRSRH